MASTHLEAVKVDAVGSLPTLANWPAMAQAARLSLESEPDLVAYDSSSILPAARSGYSYGPPSSSATPPDNTSRLSMDQRNNAHDQADNKQTPAGTGWSDFSNRSRARATSIASKFSIATLPLYSAHDTAPGPPTASTSNHRTSMSASRNVRSRDDSREQVEDDDDDEDDYSDESDLEMDTLNKNSGGKGGWKMIANTDTPLSGLFSPSTHTHPPGRASLSDSQAQREKAPSAHNQKGLKNSRFERIDRVEWIAMSVSLALVAFLTVASLQICFGW